MEHGRDHDQRRAHIRPPRDNNTPHTDPQDELEAELDRSGHARSASGHGQPPDPAITDNGPTEQAAQREQERHRLEEERGRTAGGTTGGTLREQRAPGVTREQMDEAAREADRRVAGRPLK